MLHIIAVCLAIGVCLGIACIVGFAYLLDHLRKKNGAPWERKNDG